MINQAVCILFSLRVLPRKVMYRGSEYRSVNLPFQFRYCHH